MPHTRLLSVWGKGGAGKSTLAATLSLALRERHERILLVSTDPSPAASHLLCSRRSSTSTPPCRGVDVLEISEEDVKRLWIQRFGDEVYEVVSSFLPVDKSIIDYVAGAPGIADEFMLYYIYELVRAGSHDIVVWDTVAAGASIRLLHIERELYSHLGSATRLYLRIRGTLDKIRRGRRDVLELIESWRKLAEQILSMLASDTHTAVIVSEPSRLSITVTRQLVEELSGHSVHIGGIVLNKFLAENPCPGCPLARHAAASSATARKSLEALGYPLYLSPYIPVEEDRLVDELLEKSEVRKLVEDIGL